VHSHALRPLILQRTTRDSGISRLWLRTRSSTRYGRSIARRILKTAPPGRQVIARIEGRELDAERLCEEGSDRRAEQLCREALAYELFARFYAARGPKVRRRIIGARYCYQRWGRWRSAARQIYPPRNEAMPGPTARSAHQSKRLDLATVIKVTQSRARWFWKTDHCLMRAAIEHAGAERGC
jgi:hypothetical protein